MNLGVLERGESKQNQIYPWCVQNGPLFFLSRIFDGVKKTCVQEIDPTKILVAQKQSLVFQNPPVIPCEEVFGTPKGRTPGDV